MALVQHIDFMLGINQILELIADHPEANAIKLSLGVQEDASIVMKAFGVKWDGNTAEILSGGEGVTVCPVPPDCVKNSTCINRVSSLIDMKITSGSAFNFQ